MTPPPDKPDQTADRAVRLAEALRANLHRRKAQTRARRAGEAGPEKAVEAGEGSTDQRRQDP
jgi:hypothetical protein